LRRVDVGMGQGGLGRKQPPEQSQQEQETLSANSPRFQHEFLLFQTSPKQPVSDILSARADCLKKSK
jgi:hypothetical protein